MTSGSKDRVKLADRPEATNYNSAMTSNANRFQRVGKSHNYLNDTSPSPLVQLSAADRSNNFRESVRQMNNSMMQDEPIVSVESRPNIV